MHRLLAVVTAEDSLDEVENLLSTYDTSLQVEIEIVRTKEEIFKDIKKTKEELKLKMVLKDDEKELANCKTKEEMLSWYKKQVCYNFFDENDNECRWYNPNGEWDWYQIGGRFSNYYENKSGENTELISKINFNNDYPYRLITALGYWLEDQEEIIDYINSHKNYYLTIVDCHY